MALDGGSTPADKQFELTWTRRQALDAALRSRADVSAWRSAELLLGAATGPYFNRLAIC